MATEQIQTENGVTYVIVDETDCAGLWKNLEPILKEGASAIVLDFSEVHYLNSMNIAAIISLRNKISSAGAKLAVCEMQEQIRTIFRILKLERIFDLTLDRVSAAQAVAA